MCGDNCKGRGVFDILCDIVQERFSMLVVFKFCFKNIIEDMLCAVLFIFAVWEIVFNKIFAECSAESFSEGYSD